MFNRKIKRRIAALEEFLGVLYSPKETGHRYDEYALDEFGTMKEIERLLDKKRK